MFKMDCQKKHYPRYKAWKTQSKIKPIKLGKKPGAMYCLGCKNYTGNFKPQEINMTNNVLGEKTKCCLTI